MKNLYTVDEARAFLGITRARLVMLEDVLQPERLGVSGQLRIYRRESLEEYKTAQTVAQALTEHADTVPSPIDDMFSDSQRRVADIVAANEQPFETALDTLQRIGAVPSPVDDLFSDAYASMVVEPHTEDAAMHTESLDALKNNKNNSCSIVVKEEVE
jgi:hypothetical protein